MFLHTRIDIIEQQIESLLLSYQRMQKTAGLPGYDPGLMRMLRNDLNFLELEKKSLIAQASIQNPVTER